MDAANVGKLTLKRFDGLHFIPSIKLCKFSVYRQMALPACPILI